MHAKTSDEDQRHHRDQCGAGPVDPAEAIEDVPQVLGRDPDPGIGHRDGHACAFAPGTDRHGSSRRRGATPHSGEYRHAGPSSNR